MKNNKIKYILLAISFITPVVSFAALQGILDLLTSLRAIINLVIPVIIGIALIFFFIGLIQFIIHSGEDKARAEGKQRMLWGIIILFVMFSIISILKIIGSATGISPGGSVNNLINSSSYFSY